MRNKVIVGSGYACIFIHSGEYICNVIVFYNSVLDVVVKGYEKVLPSSECLAVYCLLHEGKQGFVIWQNYKLVSSQFSFKKV